MTNESVFEWGKKEDESMDFDSEKDTNLYSESARKKCGSNLTEMQPLSVFKVKRRKPSTMDVVLKDGIVFTRNRLC